MKKEMNQVTEEMNKLKSAMDALRKKFEQPTEGIIIKPPSGFDPSTVPMKVTKKERALTALQKMFESFNDSDLEQQTVPKVYSKRMKRLIAIGFLLISRKGF